MLNIVKILVAMGFVLVAAFFLACGSAENSNNARATNPASPSPAATTDELAEEREIYKQNCAKCHKDTGVGGKITVDGKELNPKNLSSERMKNGSDQKLYDDISEGVPDDGMPAFKTKLPDADIKRVVRYIRVELQKGSTPQAK